MQSASSGRILFGDRDVTEVPANQRNVGFVFQNYSLFPHQNVFDNVAFGLKIRKLGQQEIKSRVTEALRLVDLAGFEERHPNSLSGGQQQRVSLARAIAIRPDVLLMDEPLGSLDKRLRQHLQTELRDLQRRLGITTIYVTHDQDEAFAMSHRIAVMQDGVIQQVATPEDIYSSPVNEFVACFVGDLNVLSRADGGGRATSGIRPERVSVSRAPGANHRMSGRLESLVFHGQRHRAVVRSASGSTVVADLYSSDRELVEGDDVSLGWDQADVIDLSVSNA
jgi:putative spermidine/putrescine transport system ATP-binding protein